MYSDTSGYCFDLVVKSSLIRLLYKHWPIIYKKDENHMGLHVRQDDANKKVMAPFVIKSTVIPILNTILNKMCIDIIEKKIDITQSPSVHIEWYDTNIPTIIKLKKEQLGSLVKSKNPKLAKPFIQKLYIYLVEIIEILILSCIYSLSENCRKTITPDLITNISKGLFDTFRTEKIPKTKLD